MTRSVKITGVTRKGHEHDKHDLFARSSLAIQNEGSRLIRISMGGESVMDGVESARKRVRFPKNELDSSKNEPVH